MSNVCSKHSGLVSGEESDGLPVREFVIAISRGQRFAAFEERRASSGPVAKVTDPSRHAVTRCSYEEFAVDRTTGQHRSANQERSLVAAQHNGQLFSWRRSR